MNEKNKKKCENTKKPFTANRPTKTA